MSATFRIEGTKQLASVLERLGDRAPLAMGSALFLEGESIMAKSKPLVPVDLGPLRASGHVSPPTGLTHVNKVRVKLGYGGPSAPYALFVHEGTGPAVGRRTFFPPKDVIREWVKRNIRPPAQELESVTFRVARAIGRKGLEPTKFLERPFIAAQRGMAGRLARRARQFLEREAKRAA